MKIRKVITGISPNGKSIVVSDETLQGDGYSFIPNSVFATIAGSDSIPTVPNDGRSMSYQNYFANAGGFRVFYNVLPPDTPPPDMSSFTPEEVKAMQQAMFEEAESKTPGMMQTMEPDMSGFHASKTIDFIYILSGKIILELDDGVKVELKKGDCSVQNGIRHAWRNPFAEACHMIAFSIGAK